MHGRCPPRPLFESRCRPRVGWPCGRRSAHIPLEMARGGHDRTRTCLSLETVWRAPRCRPSVVFIIDGLSEPPPAVGIIIRLPGDCVMPVSLRGRGGTPHRWPSRVYGADAAHHWRTRPFVDAAPPANVQMASSLRGQRNLAYARLPGGVASWLAGWKTMYVCMHVRRAILAQACMCACASSGKEPDHGAPQRYSSR